MIHTTNPILKNNRAQFFYNELSLTSKWQGFSKIIKKFLLEYFNDAIMSQSAVLQTVGISHLSFSGVESEPPDSLMIGAGPSVADSDLPPSGKFRK